MGFPQLANIDKRILDTINAKAGKNLRASKTMPWIRVTSCLGDFLSLQSSKESESFAQRYGDTRRHKGVQGAAYTFHTTLALELDFLGAAECSSAPAPSVSSRQQICVRLSFHTQPTSILVHRAGNSA